LFVAGDIDRSQLIDVVGQCFERVPSTPLSPRQRPASYGPLPTWKAGQTTEIETNHEDSVVYLLFPLPGYADGHVNDLIEWDFIDEVFSAGELGSPLNRLVRENSQLAYSPGFVSNSYPDGGYAGLVAQTSVEPERVIDAFWKLIRGNEIRDPVWIEYVRDTIRGAIEMHDPDAGVYTEEGSASLVNYGRVLSDDEFAGAMLGYRDEQVHEWLEKLHPDQAHAVIFKARK
jgi:predicted Zn-dependent peptidase